MNISGIYTITCLINWKIYVGLSNNIIERQKDHLWRLCGNKHENEYLQKDFNLYGKENFVFEILEEYPDEGFILPSMEHWWCNLLDVHNRDKGYNIKPTNPYNRNRHSKETIEKILESRKWYKPTQETCKKIGDGNRGKKQSEELRTRRGKILSKTLQNLSEEATRKNTQNRNKMLLEIFKNNIKIEEVYGLNGLCKFFKLKKNSFRKQKDLLEFTYKEYLIKVTHLNGYELKKKNKKGKNWYKYIILQNGVEIKKFDSIIEVREYFKGKENATCIYQACTNILKTHMGYEWKRYK